MGATGAWDLGYQGEGMSVAILDTGLSYENPSFIQEPQDQSRVAYTKEDIAAILEANELQDVYKRQGSGSCQCPLGYNNSRLPDIPPAAGACGRPAAPAH